MLIAQQKKEENIAEYILYMWQVEDMIRAENLDINRIKQSLIDRFDQPEEVKQQMSDWYEGLIGMMRLENVVTEGHLQINKNSILDLTDIHFQLLKSPQEPEYIATYYKTLPFIVELRAKSNNKNISELETCFSALYGFLLLRLQNKTVSGETQAAITQISNLLRLLSLKYKQNKNGNIEL